MKYAPYDLKFSWDEQEIGDDLNQRFLYTKNETFKIRDLINQTDIGTTKKPLQINIGIHDVLLIRLSI